jgi:hypothetical protein
VLIQKNNSKLLLSNVHNEDNLDPTQPQAENVNGATPTQEADSQRQTSQSTQQDNGRQLKDVLLVPDHSRLSESSSSKSGGAEMFELLLGIVLCRYTQRSGVSGAVNGDASGGDGQRENRERKVVVQGVVAGSPADKSANINRGESLCTFIT